MLQGWMILVAAMGQATQPATPPPATPAPVMTVAGAPRRPTVVTRPGWALREETPVTEAKAPATRPAAELPAELAGEIPALSGDPIEIHATATGELVITANKDDMAILANIIALMDRQRAGAERTTRIFTLQSAQAADIAPSVQKFWNEFMKPADGKVRPEDTLTIIPDARSNLLMVATAKEHMDEVAKIIEQLDVPAFGPEGVVKFTSIPLKHIKAAEAEQKIKDLLEALRKQRGVSKDFVNITADVRTNTLLISASERDLEQIRHLIEIIDVEPDEETGGVVKVAFVPLKKAVARDLADALNEMLATESDVAKAMQEQIRRLQIVLAAEGRELSPVNLEKPIKVFAEPGTNAIVVASVESNLAPLLEIVELLDTPPVADDVLIRIYPLEYADAETLRSNLQDVFDRGRQLPKNPGKEVAGRTPPGIPGGLVYEIGLTVDTRTNALIVSARPEQLVLVEQIVKAVDLEESANKFPVRMVHLEHADVRRIREVCQDLADQRERMAERFGDMAAERERILLVEDVRTNSLIVVANEENYNDIAELAIKLDGADDEWLGDIRILVLDKQLTAADLAGKIEDLWQRRADLRREGGLPEDKPVIVTDSRSNSLVVASNKEDFEAIERLVQQLKQQPLSPMMDIHHLVLDHHDAGEMAELIQQLFDERLKNSLAKGEEEQPSDRVFLVNDPLTNMLFIVSSQFNYEEIVRLVTKLDVPPPVEGVIRAFYVKNIDVSKAEEIIKEIFSEGLYRGSAGDRELPESMTRVTIVSDVRSSALVVSASPENYAVVGAILKEIDRVDVPDFPTEARFFKIEHADVVNVGDILTQLLEGMRDTLGDESDQLEFNIIPEVRSDRLIVVGTRFAMKRAEELVPKLDVPQAPPTSKVVVYDLKEASASQLAEVMTQLFDDRASGEQAGERTPVSIIADDASGSLVVTASVDDHVMVEHLLTLLDTESKVAQQVEIIALAEAKAQQIADTLADLLDQQNRDRERGFAITPEPRTNSLVVWAPPDMMAHIHKIVDRLDNSRPKTELALRVFKLYNAKAEELSELLNDFFEAAGAGEGDDAKQMIIRFIAGTHPETGRAVIESLVHQDVTIAPDENTNALLVMAPEANIDMMQMLIEMLDSVEPETVTVRVFQLHNADATEMKELLEELFEADQEAAPRRIAIGEGGGVATGGGALELAFSVDERTNTLIAAGSPSYLRMVESLVYKLDYEEMDQRLGKVVHLRYHTASDMADTLQTYFDEESELLEEAAGEEAAARQVQRRVIVTEAAQEDTESNTLLVSYSPRMESQVIRMINELDQPIPQVMIQVLMAEVTLTDNFELGMEFAVQDLLFSEKATLHPNTGLPQGDDYDYVFGTDIGAAGSSGLAGISFTVTGEDFGFLLRALQTEGRVEILSRPSIMVQDGQDAEITIGEQVPTVQDVSVGIGGIVTPSVSYVDVGIMLKVTPIINPDGYVNMEIEPEISAIGTSSVSIGAGITLPIFTKRNAITSVTVKDGETIIIGGLITSRENDSESKVPIAGDIPVLGNLFRSTVKSTTKTELLIVLTPHVVRVAEDARDISIEMRDSSGLNDNIRMSPLMQGLQLKPGDEQFGPDEPVSPDREQGPTVDEGEELGPELEEYGPAAESIWLGPVPAQPAIAARAG